MGNSDDESGPRGARSARKRAAKLGLVDSVLTIALCGDEKTAKCASACQMRTSWKRLRELKKQRRKQFGQRITVLRIACPGVCKFGPVAAVFPSGHWYGGCDPDTLDRIVDCYLPSPSASLPQLGGEARELRDDAKSAEDLLRGQRIND